MKNIQKRKLIYFLLIIFTLLFTKPVFAYEVDINNSSKAIIISAIEHKDGLEFEYIYGGIEAYVVNGVTMIPLRSIGERFDYTVEYKAENKKIFIRNNESNEIIFTINSNNVVINGVNSKIQSIPIVYKDRVFIPLRYVSEFFKKNITWCNSIEEATIFVWVSDLPLLTANDVIGDNNNYIQDFDIPTPYYTLIEGGKTYRGLSIGENYLRIGEIYGKYHRRERHSENIYTDIYYTEFLPGTSSGSRLLITVKNDIVSSVYIDGAF